MKKIEVVAAIIYKEDRYLATQRGNGEFKGLWEFPGGKIEVGESHEVALKREIYEELNLSIEVERFVCTTEFDYPSFYLKMHCYLCSSVAGEMELREHLSYRWLSTDTLNEVKWLPADKEVVRELQNYSIQTQ
jgi:8-oxo-dGTP diphosphatase